ncbi:MAG: hypothetical protein D6790_20995, partial [Caldilineae bacterium]
MHRPPSRFTSRCAVNQPSVSWQIQPRFSLLDETACKRIHQASLQILARTGVRVLEPQARLLLKEAGASVEDEL